MRNFSGQLELNQQNAQRKKMNLWVIKIISDVNKFPEVKQGIAQTVPLQVGGEANTLQASNECSPLEYGLLPMEEKGESFAGWRNYGKPLGEQYIGGDRNGDTGWLGR